MSETGNYDALIVYLIVTNNETVTYDIFVLTHKRIESFHEEFSHLMESRLVIQDKKRVG